jgi:hypothetical protein
MIDIKKVEEEKSDMQIEPSVETPDDAKAPWCGHCTTEEVDKADIISNPIKTDVDLNKRA